VRAAEVRTRLPPLIVARAEGQTYDGSRGGGTGSTAGPRQVMGSYFFGLHGDISSALRLGALKLLTAKAAKKFRKVRKERRTLQGHCRKTPDATLR
jgi:hypothetical protein